MELLIVAGLLIFVLMRGGTLGLTTGSGAYYQAGQVGQPGFQNPQAPFTAGQFAIQQSQQLTGEVNAAIGIGVNTAEKFVKAGTGFAKAIPVIGEAVAAVADIFLAQHTARLKGAISENQLIPTVVNAYDSDLREIVSAFNSGSATRSQCAAAIYQMWNSIHSYMKSNATGPGRAWRDFGGIDQIPHGFACDKSCTAECCVFWIDMHPAMANLYSFWSTGKPLEVSNNNYTGWPPTNNGKTLSDGIDIKIITVQPPNNPAYGNFSRSGYTLTLRG